MSLFLQNSAALATAVGVLVAVWQLRQSGLQARLQFEDGLNEQYRALLKEIPLDALLGKPLPPEHLVAALPVFYRYFDLSNEQAFLSRLGRVRRETWTNWREGIEQNMRRPAFTQAWERLLPDLGESFDELRRITASLSRATPLRGLASARERSSPNSHTIEDRASVEEIICAE